MQCFKANLCFQSKSMSGSNCCNILGASLTLESLQTNMSSFRYHFRCALYRINEIGAQSVMMQNYIFIHFSTITLCYKPLPPGITLHHNFENCNRIYCFDGIRIRLQHCSHCIDGIGTDPPIFVTLW